MLLNAGADADAKDGDGDTPLNKAASASLTWFPLVSCSGLFALRPTRPCSGYGYAEVVEVLIRRTAKKLKINSPDSDGMPPLHSASQGGYVEVVKHLIEGGADVNRMSGDDTAALHEAAFSSSPNAGEVRGPLKRAHFFISPPGIECLKAGVGRPTYRWQKRCSRAKRRRSTS